MKQFLATVILILGLAASCTNTDELNNSNIDVSDVSSQELADHNAIDDAQEDAFNNDNDFCRDDIYAKHFSKEYA